MGGRNDDGANAILLLFCSLDTLRRVGGPWGSLFACALSAVLVIAAVVWIIVLATASRDGDASETQTYAHAKHNPDERTAYWTNFLWVILIVSILTTPTCYYMPCMNRRRVVVHAEPVVDGNPVAGPVAHTPLVALSVPTA